MENSSYSKTRSPARFLAAFLAFVMVLIVMPVLPVGAATVTKVTFVDVIGDNQKVYFNDGPNYLEDMFTSLPGSGGTFGATPMITYSSVEKSGKDGNSLTFTLTGNKLRGLAFYATPTVSDELVLYAQLDENAKVELPKDASDKYTLPAEIIGSTVSGTEVKIWAEVKPATYNVTFTGISAYTADYKIGDDGKATAVFENIPISVEQGKKLTLELTDVPVADSLTLSARIGSPEAEITNTLEDIDGGKFTWTIENISGNTTFQIKKAERKVGISFNNISGTGYNTDRRSTSDSVTYGEGYTFVVTTTVGYKAPEVKITETDGGQDFTDFVKSVNGQATTYSLHNIKKALTITITEKGKETRRVEFPSNTANNGYKLSGGQSSTGDYEFDSKLTFTVTREDGWTGTPTVTAFGRTWTPNDTTDDGSWEYELTVTDNTIVQISGFTRITHTVTINNSTGISQITPATQTVNHKEDAVFRVTLADGYTLKDNSGKVTLKKAGVEGSTVEGKVSKVAGTNGVYNITIESVEGNLDLIIEGIEKIEYTITVAEGKYTVEFGGTQQGTVKHGESLGFTVEPKPGYRIKNVVFTPQDGVGVPANQLSGNSYSISGVTNNGQISVTTELITWTVVFNFPTSTKGMLGRTDTQTTQKTLTFTVESDGNKLTDLNGGGYSLNLPEPTRDGWKFEGWKNEENLSTKKLEFADQNNHNVQLEAVWTVNTTGGVDSEKMFFDVLLQKFDLKDGVTNFVAEVHTNLSPEDQTELDSQVSVVGWGFFYGADANAITNQTSNPTALCEFLAGGSADNSHTSKYNGTNLYYYKFPTSDQNAMTNGATFKLHLKGTQGNMNWNGAAWVILKIEGKNYLFVSTPQQVTAAEG